jgi:hypothetical protein
MEAAERRTQHRHDRLAELVWHLTECEPEAAMTAVDVPVDGEDFDLETALELVARGLWRIKHIDLRTRVDLRDQRASRATEPTS